MSSTKRLDTSRSATTRGSSNTTGGGVSASSFLGLKADLASRQEEVKRRSSQNDRGAESADSKSSKRLPAYLLPDSELLRASKRQRSSDRGGSGGAASSTKAGSTSSWASTPSAQLDAARAALERKAAIYEKLKRGKHAGLDDATLAETLVDWERQAEENASSNDDDEEEEERLRGPSGESAEGRRSGTMYLEAGGEDDPLVEYTDEFGRTRMVPRSEVPRDWLRAHAETTADQAGGEGGEAGDDAIYGPATHFPVYRAPSPTLEARRRAAELASTPVQRFDATREVRSKGAGFYRFSADEATRRREMEELVRARRETERMRDSGDAAASEAGDGAEAREGDERSRARREREARLEARRSVVAAKRREVLARREDERSRLLGASMPSAPILGATSSVP